MTTRHQPGDLIAGRYEVHFGKMCGMGVVYLCLGHGSMSAYATVTFRQKCLIHQNARGRSIQEALTGRNWKSTATSCNAIGCGAWKASHVCSRTTSSVPTTVVPMALSLLTSRVLAGEWTTKRFCWSG